MNQKIFLLEKQLIQQLNRLIGLKTHTIVLK